jgi:oxygen-dependent protoporphyrinogen oxidase
MARLVVVGAGISGLAAAWSAHAAAARAGVALDVLVLECADEPGGKARTVSRDGWMVEAGPSGFLGGRAELDALIGASGIAADVVAANENAKRRFVYRAGKLRELKPSPIGLAFSGIMSPGGMLRLALEPFVARSESKKDESVWAFAERRFGTEAADRLMAPATLGVFAGDAHKLSVASGFPKFRELEREHGSLIRGIFERRGRGRAGGLTSFREGMQSLPHALAERGGFQVRCNALVKVIDRTATGWAVTVDGDSAPIVADAVIIATEPWAAAPLVHHLDAAAGDALKAIPCPHVTVVALGYDSSARERIPDGFGVLISRGEGIRMLGNLWETSIYPGRGPSGGILVRALLGGAIDQEIGSLDDAEVLALAKGEIARLYGLAAEPVFSEVIRIDGAIPQYEIGHARRVAAVEHAAAAIPGLGITGYGLRGVAFGDAAADGMRTGERIGAWLAAAG